MPNYELRLVLQKLGSSKKQKHNNIKSLANCRAFKNTFILLKILLLILTRFFWYFVWEILKSLFFERRGFGVAPIVIKSNFDAAVTMNNNSGITRKSSLIYF